MAATMRRDWRWGCHGYEGLLVDNYHALLAVLDDVFVFSARMLLNLRYGERFQAQDMDKVQPIPAGLLGPIRLTVTDQP
jgi:hypothetical protein